MAIIKEFTVETRYGVKVVELTRGEYWALIEKGGVSEDSTRLIGKAALILETLDTRNPLAPSKIATLCGVSRAQDSTWNKALVALSEAGLVEKWSSGPKTAYTRSIVEDLVPEIAAVDIEGWEYRPHHTLVVGGEQDARNAFLNAILLKFSPFVGAGTAKVREVGRQGGSVSALSSELKFIEDAREEITRRLSKAADTSDFTPRSPVVPSVEEPMIVLVFHDFPAFINDLMDLGEQGKEALSNLDVIFATGRSAAVYVVVATKTTLNQPMRSIVDNFGTRAATELDSRYENDVLLGEEASWNGYDATRVDREKTGVAGFVSEGYGEPVKLRFPYVTDRAMTKLSQRFKEGSN